MFIVGGDNGLWGTVVIAEIEGNEKAGYCTTYVPLPRHTGLRNNAGSESAAIKENHPKSQRDRDKISTKKP